MARASEFFYKDSKSKKILRGWGLRRMAWVSIFFTKKKHQNLKKEENIYIFCSVLGRGMGAGVGMVSDFFYKESKSTQFFFFFFFWGGGRGSLARRSVARVSEFFLHRIQI